MATDPNDWNKKIIEEFRTNHGKVGGMFKDSTLLLLTTTGAKSGQQRTSPLACIQDNGHMYIVASKAGAPTNPDWYHNIVAHPEVTVELGDQKFNARGVVLTGKERDEAFARIVQLAPGFGEYEKKTTRVIPVVELIRQ
jgi:deazaflavin-dependent oxidoreductase (nitroreductase family)